jgi:hypothetical protein
VLWLGLERPWGTTSVRFQQEGHAVNSPTEFYVNGAAKPSLGRVADSYEKASPQPSQVQAEGSAEALRDPYKCSGWDDHAGLHDVVSSVECLRGVD